MKHGVKLLTLCSVLALSLAAWRTSAPQAQGEVVDNQPLFEEIHLLNFIRDLRLSQEQMESLLKAAKELDAQRQTFIGKRNSPEARKLLLQIRQALIEGKNEDELGPLFEQLEMLINRGEERGEPEPQIRQAAQEKAKQAVALLTPQQIVRLVGPEGEGDLTAQFMEVVTAARRNPQARADILRDFPRRIAHLLAHGDAKKEEAVTKQAQELMSQAVQLSDAEFNQKRSDLQKQWRQMVQGVAGSPFVLLQAQVEERMADVLMNPRFAKVLEEKLNYVKGK